MKYGFYCLFFFLAGCAAIKGQKPEPRFLGQYTIPLNQRFQQTIVGGLSGIDYDAASNRFIMISDDGSKINPARFYTAQIRFDEKGIDTVEILSSTTLLSQAGLPYMTNVIDPESIRFGPAGTIYWSSEGRRNLGKGETVMVDPGVKIVNASGLLLDSLPLPSNMHFTRGEKGPRHNGSFEGLSFNLEKTSLFVAVEEPLYEDGPRAGTDDSAAIVRFIRYDVASGKPQEQYAYPIDPVAKVPNPPGAFRINGVPEILWLSKKKMLVMERSYSTGHQGCVVKLFEADLAAARPLPEGRVKQFHPMKKRLILNLSDLGIEIFNVEGMCFGPLLPNGHRSLIMVADDNFSSNDKTQFLLFDWGR